jgi:hypothetical protein
MNGKIDIGAGDIAFDRLPILVEGIGAWRQMAVADQSDPHGAQS